MRIGKLLLLNAALLVAVGASLCFSQEVKPMGRTRPCEGCKPGERHITVNLTCSPKKVARAVPKDVSADASSLTPGRNSVVWEAKSSWTVKFDAKTPCQRSSFNAKSAACKVKGAAGKYSYTITLDGCSSPGKASFTVK
jgi:hypothetical protein